MLIDREAAAAQGLKRYFTGEPCGNGHTVECYVVNKRCVQCAAAARKKHRAEKSEQVRDLRQAYRDGRREIERKQERDRRAANPEMARARMQRWRQANRDRELAANRQSWPARRARQMQKKRARYASDPVYALATRVRNRIGDAFREAGYTKRAKAAEILGCSWSELKRHIERQFLKGMTWENRGRAWHVDHIVPLASAGSVSEVVALNHFTNLRPLWAADNQKKHAKRQHLI